MWGEIEMPTSGREGWRPPLLHLPSRGRLRVLGITALAGVGLLAGVATPAQAATTEIYAAPADLGTADCSTPADACAIVTAVTNANAAPITDDVRIALARGNYALPGPSPTALPITFAGPSLTLEATSGSATLNGKKTVRLLSIGAASNVTIDGVDFAFGTSANLGGAIQNSGKLTVRNATFSGNTGSNGGAIANDAVGTLAVEDSTFSHNTATGVGGAAIISSGPATIDRVALVNNDAPINGGGINVQPGGTVTLSNSTVAGNTSGGLGGGISNLGTLTVQGTTIANNSASSGTAIATGNANVTLAATIVAKQSSSGTACDPANGTIVDGGYNLDSDGTCILPASPATGSHSGTDAYGASTYAAALDAYLARGLANNGGPSKTLALLNSPSPLTDAANPALGVVPPDFALPVAVGGATTACAAADQRGVVPAAGANCNIGAYLLQATKTELTASAESIGQHGSVTYTAKVTPTPDAGTVSFDDGAGNPATTQCAAQPLANGTATCTVSYPQSGGYTVGASYSGDGAANDYAGSESTTRTLAVAVPAVAPPAAPAPTAPPAAAPGLALSKLTVTRCLGTAKGARKSITGGYVINAPARVTLTLQRRVKLPNGARKTCPKSIPAGASADYANVPGSSARAVTRAVAVIKARALTTTASVGAGSHAFSLKSLLGSKKLAPGRYRILVQAVGATGTKVEKSAYFWVLEPKGKKASTR